MVCQQLNWPWHFILIFCFFMISFVMVRALSPFYGFVYNICLRVWQSLVWLFTQVTCTKVPVLAGLDSHAVREATHVSWMYCWIYLTREFMYKMKQVKSPACACETGTTENLPHFLFHCLLYISIREQYIPKYVSMNKNIVSICDDEHLQIISFLDPLSSKLPEIVT